MALGSEIPPGEHGQFLRDQNAELVKQSFGLLPECQLDDLEIVTVVCSHTHQRLRIPKGHLPAPEGFEDLAGPAECITPESIISKSASMKEPMET